MEQNSGKAFVELAQAPVATTNGAGSALFVINLCASMTPLTVAGKTLPGLESYRLYQVARAEDGRTRHRLRLGFFATEADAEQTLAAVRALYPTAFTTCLADEDRKFARGFVASTTTTTTAALAKPPMSVVVDNDSTRPLKVLRPEAAPSTDKPAIAAAAHTTAAVAPSRAAPSPAAADPAVIEIEFMPAEVATVAKPATAAAASARTQPAKNATAAVEIEMSWAAPSAHQSATKVATPPAQVATVTAAPASLKQTATAAPHPSAVAAKPPVTPAAGSSKPSNAVSTELELASSIVPATGTADVNHRGMVAAKAPLLDSIQLTLDTEPAPTSASTVTATTPDEPFRVGKGVDIPITEFTLDDSPAPAISAATDASHAMQTGPAANVVRHNAMARAAMATQAPVRAATQAAPAATTQHARPAATSAAITQADLDSTQTIRALTEAELNDESQEKWFAIQLAVSEQPVNLDAMPHLDIFEAYRLYSIATAGHGKITHSLRLGFFREQVSAEAVCGYLKTFFPKPTIERISIAEHARFKEAPDRPASVDAAAGKDRTGKVIEISEARARNASPVVPTVTMEVPTPADSGASGTFRPNATGSFNASATGSFKTGATGKYQVVKPAAKSALPAVKRSPPLAGNKKAATGKHPALNAKSPLQSNHKSPEMELSESAVRKLPKSASLLARLVGKLAK